MRVITVYNKSCTVSISIIITVTYIIVHKDNIKQILELSALLEACM